MVLDYIESLENEVQRDLMLHLHELICTFPNLEGKIRYKVPMYYLHSWLCYLNPLKDGGVELCFIRANELSNAQGLLHFKDRKQVAGISFYKINDIPTEPLLEILQEALLLDETMPYASKRKKKQ